MTAHLDPRQIDALLDGEWGPSARRHIEACPACRSAYERQRQLRAARDLAAPPALSSERSRAMQERFADALEQERRAPRPLAVPRPLLVAAGIGVLFILSSAALVLWSPSASVAPQTTSHDQARVAPVVIPSPAQPAPEATLVADLELPGALPLQMTTEAEEPRQPRDRSATRASKPARPASALRFEPADTRRPRSGSLRSPSAEAHQRGQQLASPGQLEAVANAYLDEIESAREREQITLAFAEFREFCATRGRAMEPRALNLLAERVASLALPAPLDEEAAYLACESALAAQRYESAYRICSTYLERFPRGPRARDVAYLTATVARRYLGDCRAAVTRYTQALMFSGMLQSFNDEAYFGRALCHAQLGQQEAARADLDLYLHKRPSRIDAAEVKALAEELGRPSSPTRDR